MRSIGIINQKGGVGKTTTAVNAAAALARDGQRVLLLDLDPQAHATMHLGIELGPNDVSMYEVLLGEAGLADAARHVGEHLTVIPAHIDLVGTELELADRPERERVLARALQTYPDGFDICLIDCPPSLGLLTVNALAATRELIIPLQPHFLALQGLGRLLQTATLVRQELNPALRVTGIVLCLFERGTRLAQEVVDDVTRFLAGAQAGEVWHGARVLTTTIRRNIKLAEAPSFGQTIFDYAPSSHGAEDYRALAREILALAAADRVPAQDPGTDSSPAARAAAEISTAIPETTASRAEHVSPL